MKSGGGAFSLCVRFCCLGYAHLIKQFGWFFSFFFSALEQVHRLFERSVWVSWSLKPFLEAFLKNCLHSLDFCWIISRRGSLKYFKINFAWNTLNPLISTLRLFFTPGSFPCSYYSLLLLFCLIYFSKVSLISKLNHRLNVSLIIFCVLSFFSVFWIQLLCITVLQF